jgi:4-amino-4-deoxy-L-arabinose transferase-like glycosyltransferase
MADGLFTDRGMGWRFYQSLGYKMANRAPLYPLLLWAIRRVAEAWSGPATIIVQSAVGAFGCLAPYLLGRRFGGRLAARWALVGCAFWPYFVVIDSTLVEHVLYAPLFVLSVWLVMRTRDLPKPASSRSGIGTAWAAGVACGLTALTRLTFGLALPFLALSVLLRSRQRRTAFWKTVCLTLGVCLVLLPWGLRNQAAVGSFTVGTDGGRALWLSNAPGTFDHYPGHSIDVTEYHLLESMPQPRMDELLALADDEVAQNREFLQRALANIGARPGVTAWGGLRKLGALWSPVYNPAPIRPGAVHHMKAASHLVTFVLLLGGVGMGLLFEPRIRADLPVILAATIGIVAPAVLFWGQTRYLAPIHGVGIALAAAGGCAYWRQRRRSTESAALEVVA